MNNHTKHVPRVALVTPGFGLGGGAGTMTAFLYRVLAESGRYRPEVISLATSASDAVSVIARRPGSWLRGPRTQSGQWRGMSYQHVGAYWVEFEFQRYKPRLALNDILAQYDVVQFVVGAAPWACTAADIRQPVLIWTATTLLADRLSRIRELPFSRRLWTLGMTRIAQAYEQRALRQADFVFALSNYTLEAIRPWIQPGHYSLGFSGIDTSLFQPGDETGQNYILCVGRFSDARKNIQLLLQAYARLADRQASLPDLYLVGELPSEEVLQWVAASGLSNRIFFPGVKAGQELAELYRRANIFVLSSDEEGLGIVILEAMASGLPVISTNCGGPATAIVEGETGLLTPVGDVEALAEAMQHLLDDAPLRQRMGQAGRRRVEEKFSLGAAGNVYLAKYDELLGI